MPVPAAVDRDRLTEDELRAFDRDGYVVLRDWLGPPFGRELIAEIDALEADRAARPVYAYPAHGRLIAHPPLLAVMEQLLGPAFLFHHVHAYRHDAGAPGVGWHNDYEQVPHVDRHWRNVIVLLYPLGLDGRVGDLVVVPGSHAAAHDWYALTAIFGTAPLPGERVIDALPPGSAVIAHTGLLHCRRPRPGAGPRYFTDLTYCQRGTLWPSWSEGDWRRMYRECIELGHDAAGRCAHLFDASQFFDQRDARERLARHRGSLWPLLADRLH